MPFIVACALFLFLEGWKRETARRKEETQVRQAEGRNATPLGGREKRDPVRRPCGFAIRLKRECSEKI